MLRLCTFSLFLSFSLCLKFCDSARIFGHFLFPSVSHQVVYQPIWKELSLRGHEVTVLTPNPLNDATLTNLTEIDVSSSYDLLAKKSLQEAIPKDISQAEIYSSLFTILKMIFEHQIQHPQVKKLIEERPQFDLVIVEGFYPGVTVFGEIFKAPLINVASLDVFPNTYMALEAHHHPVSHPNLFFTKIYEEMTLLDRVRSVYVNVWYKIWYEWVLLPDCDAFVKNYFGVDLPYIGEIERNASMVFVNVNKIVNGVFPSFPFVVTLGQMHLKPEKPLPKDLQDILDDSSEGVVYFSLGSNIKSIHLDEQVQKRLIKTFAELPFKILWKWENETLDNHPKNVIIRKWLPQQSVLAHKNIKVFVTQGGLQSLEETIIHRVPIIGMPFIADQPMNVQRIAKWGAGLYLDPENFSKEELKAQILEVASNGKFREKMAELKGVIGDEPMSGLEKAVWWCEYVIRHKGAKYLHPTSIPLYQYLLLDQILFVFVVVLFIYFVFAKFVKQLRQMREIKIKKQ